MPTGIPAIAEQVGKWMIEHPDIAVSIYETVRDVIQRDDPKTAAAWHAEKAAHSLATERQLRSEGTF